MIDSTYSGYTAYNIGIVPKQDHHYGWICPKCENCLAPHVQHCFFCQKPYYSTINGGTAGNIGGIDGQ